MKKTAKLLILGLLFISASAFAGKELWLTDFKKAQKTAKAQSKVMLINFTGSDWCPWCVKLEKEVFSTAVFKKFAKKNLVLLKVDFPRGKKQSSKLRAQNKKLAAKFKINAFPTILLLSSDTKKIIGKTGYKRGGAEKYVVHLKKLLKKNKTGRK